MFAIWQSLIIKIFMVMIKKFMFLLDISFDITNNKYMRKVCYSWIGTNDYDNDFAENSPIGTLMIEEGKNFDLIVLLNGIKGLSKQDILDKLKDLEHAADLDVIVIETPLDDPGDYEKVYNIAKQVLEKTYKKFYDYYFYLSAGTSVMSAIWIMLGKTLYPGGFYQSSPETGTNKYKVKNIDIPFSITADYLKKELSRFESIDDDNTTGQEGGIFFESDVMKKTVAMAKKISVHPLNVLITGESGTGKELFADYIQGNSDRKEKPFIKVNCSAFPENIIESMLFGYSKGAFTGADKDTKGLFENADGGTIFLDEIADLPVTMQAKLLRVVESGEVLRVGDMKKSVVNVRIIAATNKDIFTFIRKGFFREDLMYRIAEGIIELSPLRDRENDAVYLAEVFLDKFNREFKEKTALYEEKGFIDDAKEFIADYNWDGNVRELYSTIKRCCILSSEKIIDSRVLSDYIFQSSGVNADDSEPFTDELPDNLEKYLVELEKSYIYKALERCNGNKTKAAKMLGYKSYQTLDYQLGK